jgi:hypothetical protein
MRSLVSLTLFLLAAAGCGSPWHREVTYSESGVTLYREYKVEQGRRVPLGYPHPFELPADKAVTMLSQLAFREDHVFKPSQQKYIFSPQEVAAFAPPLSAAVKQLAPDERLRFLIARSNWTDVILGSTGTSGVLFQARAGVVNIAFDRIQETIPGGEGGEPMKVPFKGDPTEITDADPIFPGSGMKMRFQPETGEPYPRWVEVVLAEVIPAAPPAVVAGAAPATPAVAPGTPPAGAPAATTPAPAVAQEAKPAPTASGTAPPPSTGARDPAAEARYQRVRERLEGLKRLKADGVLTEEEYRAEYEKALKEW